MAEINLLTAATGAIKHPIPSLVQKLSKASVLVLLVSGVFFALGISLRAQVIFQERGLKAITERKRQNEEMIKKLNALKAQQVSFQQEESMLQNLPGGSMQWAQKLSRLRELLPEEIWLTRFSFNNKSAQGKEPSSGVLTLKGSLIPQQDTSALGTLSAFMSQITTEKLFPDFSAPVLKESHEETYQKTKVMTFTIEMLAKPQEPPSNTQH